MLRVNFLRWSGVASSVAVPARFRPGFLDDLELNDQFLHDTADEFDAFAFVADPQQLLLKFEIERKSAGDPKGQVAVGPGKVDGDLIGFPQALDGAAKELDGGLSLFVAGDVAGWVVVEERDSTSQVSLLFVCIENFESPGTNGKDIHPPVFVFSRHIDDARRAAYGLDPLRGGADDSELLPSGAGSLSSEAFTDHQLVALFENVKGKRLLGEEHDLERKYREQ